MSEVAACGDSCGMGEGFPCMPMGGECQVAGLVKMTAEKPYVSTATMLAPSPDWCAHALFSCILRFLSRDLFRYVLATHLPRHPCSVGLMDPTEAVQFLIRC